MACLVYLAFGMPVAMLGVAWPTLRDELGRADGDLGVLVLAYGLGRLVTSASSGPLLARLPYGTGECLDPGRVGGGRGVGGHEEPQWAALIAAFGLIGVLSGMLDSLGAPVPGGLRQRPPGGAGGGELRRRGRRWAR